MHLAKFGVITLSGAVNRPKLGADFDGYQNTLSTYQSTRAIAKRLQGNSQQLDRRPRKLAGSSLATPASF